MFDQQTGSTANDWDASPTMMLIGPPTAVSSFEAEVMEAKVSGLGLSAGFEDTTARVPGMNRVVRPAFWGVNEEAISDFKAQAE